MYLIENYLNWMNHKFFLTNLPLRKFQVNEGEVYWCSFGLNVGDEENGKGTNFRRPVLVVKKFNNNIFLGIPMTTKLKDNKYYIKVLLKDEIVSAMISQIRIIDSKRLDEKIGYIKRKDFENVKLEIKNMF